MKKGKEKTTVKYTSELGDLGSFHTRVVLLGFPFASVAADIE